MHQIPGDNRHHHKHLKSIINEPICNFWFFNCFTPTVVAHYIYKLRRKLLWLIIWTSFPKLIMWKIYCSIVKYVSAKHSGLLHWILKKKKLHNNLENTGFCTLYKYCNLYLLLCSYYICYCKSVTVCLLIHRLTF